MKPKEPFVVIGGGLSGLMACWTLERAGYHAILLERATRVGGRASTMYGSNWAADTGIQFIRRSDDTLMHLTRALGIEESLVTIQGALGTFDSRGVTSSANSTEYDSDRLAFENGFQALANALARELTIPPPAFVTSVKWDAEDESFWFETERGEPLHNSTTGKLLFTKGVVLATNSLQAAAIARRSLCLSPLVRPLEAVRTDPAVMGVFIVPRVRSRFYAVQGMGDAKLRWVAFEERKSPTRAPADRTVLIAQASAAFSEFLLDRSETDTLSAIYDEARGLFPTLSPDPIERYQVVWPAARLEGKPLPASRQFQVTNPDGLPFALAGEYVHGARAEDAATAGVFAARRLIEIYGRRHGS